jgi:predicted ArsR family transcriptional regulator
MQTTRERILSILKERGQVTVDELSQELGLTAVTVRHHLDILRGEGLIAPPRARRRKAPGRPKYVYSMTKQASAFFPKRYDQLATALLSEMKEYLSPTEMDHVIEHIGESIAHQADLPDTGDFETQLIATVEFLNGLGYMARWEKNEASDYLLYIANCPYEQVARQDHDICKVDVKILTLLLGTPPKRTSWAAQGDHQCTYVVRPPSGW